jgi:hypothetical protein
MMRPSLTAEIDDFRNKICQKRADELSRGRGASVPLARAPICSCEQAGAGVGVGDRSSC